MINHPLFNENDGNEDRAARDIGYINIRQFQGSKAITLPNQWDPEELQTVEDLYNAVGVGRFELIGRHALTKRVVDRTVIEIQLPKGAGAPAEPMPQQQQARWQAPEPQQPQQPTTPTMVAGGLQIPPGMDPQMAMMIAMMTTSQQTTNTMIMGSREDAKFYAAQQTELMLGFTRAQAEMITGLVGALAGGRGGGGSGESTEAFLKGVELMADIKAGMREGDPSNEEKTPGWGEIAKNIAESLRAVKDIASITSSAPAAPVIDPGVPT